VKPLPETHDPVLLRTDFSDDAAWKAICSAIEEPPEEDQAAFAQWAALVTATGQPMGELKANLEIIDDPEYRDISTDQVLKLLAPHYTLWFLFIVDRLSVSHAEHPILVVDLLTEPGRAFRTIPSQIQGIENNLSIANLDWDSFAEMVDADGVFRGFPKE
jgi:hypothetical protein